MTHSNKIPTLLLQGLLKGYSLKNLKWILNQAHLETGHFTSRIFRELNSPFGMSCVRSRKTTQIGCENLSDGNTAGVYSSRWSAINDRFLWDEEFGINPRSNNYAKEVSKSYHPSSTYEQSVTNTRADLHGGFGLLSWVLVFAPLPILAIIVYLLK